MTSGDRSRDEWTTNHRRARTERQTHNQSGTNQLEPKIYITPAPELHFFPLSPSLIIIIIIIIITGRWCMHPTTLARFQSAVGSQSHQCSETFFHLLYFSGYDIRLNNREHLPVKRVSVASENNVCSCFLLILFPSMESRDTWYLIPMPLSMALRMVLMLPPIGTVACLDECKFLFLYLA